MYCSKCGAPLPDGSNFCTRCGAAVPTATGTAPTESPRAESYVPKISRPTENPYAAYRPEVPQEPAFPMKWFKFTIYFQLFANAVLNFFNAMSSFMGLSYGLEADAVYFVYPGLHTLDMLTGVLYLVLVIFAFITRFQLAKFKKHAPVMLYIFLALNLVLLIFYLVSASIITGINLINPSNVSNAVVLLILIVCDYIYFNKRKELFVK